MKLIMRNSGFCFLFINFLGFPLSFLFSQGTPGRTYISQDPNYINNIDSAYKHYDKEEYFQAIQFFESALTISKMSGATQYRLAVCYIQANELDTAITILNNAYRIEPKWVRLQLESATEEKKLSPLKKDSRWNSLFESYPKIIEEWEKRYNLSLRTALKEIRRTDQLRSGIKDSRNPDSLWKIQNRIDSINTIRIEEIIAEYGYPGDSMVGPDLGSVAWLVIQHADLPIQEKYFPLLKEATEKGQLKKSSFALLVDRIEMRNEKPQIYGSQIRMVEGKATLYTLIDPEHVDDRRKEMGLGPIKNYLEMFGIMDWKP